MKWGAAMGGGNKGTDQGGARSGGRCAISPAKGKRGKTRGKIKGSAQEGQNSV